MKRFVLHIDRLVLQGFDGGLIQGWVDAAIVSDDNGMADPAVGVHLQAHDHIALGAGIQRSGRIGGRRVADQRLSVTIASNADHRGGIGGGDGHRASSHWRLQGAVGQQAEGAHNRQRQQAPQPSRSNAMRARRY